MKFGTVILCNVTKKKKKNGKKEFQIAAIELMASLIMSIFLKKLCEKWVNCFFLKLTLSQLEKRFSRPFFSF